MQWSNHQDNCNKAKKSESAKKQDDTKWCNEAKHFQQKILVTKNSTLDHFQSKQSIQTISSLGWILITRMLIDDIVYLYFCVFVSAYLRPWCTWWGPAWWRWQEEDRGPWTIPSTLYPVQYCVKYIFGICSTSCKIHYFGMRIGGRWHCAVKKRVPYGHADHRGGLPAWP